MDVFLDIIRHIRQWIGTDILAPIITDATYRRGYFAGIMTVVVFGVFVWLRIQLLMALAKIRAFFLPSALPATRPGPSGYDRALGCRDGFLRVGCIILAIILILAALAGFAVI